MKRQQERVKTYKTNEASPTIEVVPTNEVVPTDKTHLAESTYTNRKLLTVVKFLLPVVILGILILLSFILGAERISFQSVFSKTQTDKFSRIIFFNIRLPRTILALLTGALLAGTGVILQGFFRNGLADSGIMGISAGATLGAVCSGFLPVFLPVVAGVTGVVAAASATTATTVTNATKAAITTLLHFISPIPFCAFFGALLTGLIIYLIAGTRRSNSSVTLLLTGTALGTFFSAITSIILLLRDKELHKIYIWNLGSFNAKGWNDVLFVIIPTLISFLLLFICARPLDLLSDGEETAQSLGVEQKRLRFLVLFASSLAVAASVCAGGTIGFVGLIAPHICRAIFGPSHRRLLVSSMITGSAMLLACDIIARTVASPTEIPVGIITSLVGAPFFLYIMTKGNTYGR